MKKIFSLLLLIVFGISLAGCAPKSDSGKPEKAEPKKTIVIGVMPDVESIPFVIAQKNGYFKKEAVSVKLEPFKSAKDRDSALQSGQLDGMITDVVAVAFANEGGIKLRIVSRNEGNIELLAGKNSGLTSTAALEGKSIGLSTNTIMEYTLDQMLSAGKIQPAAVKKVAIPPLPTRFEMLETGKIDAAILPEPLAGLAVKDGARVLNSTDQMANKAGAIAFTAQSLAQNPEEIKAIFRAYNQAVDYMAKEPAASYIDTIIQSQGFPAGVKDSLQLPKYKYAAAPDPKIVDSVIEWMRDKGLITNNYTYKDLVDDSLLKE
ncbi:MAG: ABC transporter substrate-binding protein [Solirubrobacterales bacterium]